MLASCVEKPPSETAENAWQIASSQLMPHTRSARMPPSVSRAYTSQSERAVSVMRGASFSSFTGPGASALESCRPPTPRSGITATATTMTARPPSQMSECRQKLIEGASASSPSSTVEPVVVSPDIVSKNARVKVIPGNVRRSGRVAEAARRIQPRVTSRKPSRAFSSRRCR